MDHHTPRKQDGRFLHLVPGTGDQHTAPGMHTLERSSYSAHPCPVCQGKGFLRMDVPFGHPQFGKAQPCACTRAELRAKRRARCSRLSTLDLFADRRLSNFNWRAPGVQDAYLAACAFAEAPRGWLLLIGPNGSGKTHLAAGIANQLLEHELIVVFATMADLLDQLRASFAPEAEVGYDTLFALVREVDVLLIDDLGAEQPTPWAEEKLFQLLGYRYDARLATVITANAAGLERVDGRIRSRLSDVGLVQQVHLADARDYRPQNLPRT